MKILYAIQGTGNGHIARAEELIPILYEFGKVDLFVSGAQADITLPFPIKYRSKGLSFFFGKDGGIDFIKTFKFNSSKRVVKEIQEFPVEHYDLVLNDFEAITAWACKSKKIPCIALSHQFALQSPFVPKPVHMDPIGGWFIKNYAPVKQGVGFHFSRFDQNIFTPVIRERIRSAKVVDKGHYCVYLPAYEEAKIIKILSRFENIRWEIFSKHTRAFYETGRIKVFPINNQKFAESLASCRGVLCGAGFETPAEALYMGKKLMVIPMKNQYEQHYNAAALKHLGVPILKKLGRKSHQKISDWLDVENRPEVNYPLVSRAAIEAALSFLEKNQRMMVA